MSNNLKTIQTAYRANTRPRHHNGGRLTQKRFNNYNRMPDMITNENGYYWREGFNKMYGRHIRLVEPGLVTDQLKDFTLKVDKQLRMTDFFYDGVSKKDLKLIRNRFKKNLSTLKVITVLLKTIHQTAIATPIFILLGSLTTPISLMTLTTLSTYSKTI